jgi:hypothetical protein
MLWIFDRLTRLESLIERARLQADFLRRELGDTPRHSLARSHLYARLGRTETRMRRLQAAARRERRDVAQVA